MEKQKISTVERIIKKERERERDHFERGAYLFLISLNI
jgi:hypothetical protein